MKAIMLMFDSLNRHMLSPYGCDWTHTENFRRLADRCVTFDNSYAASLPCMPARRELHTGRYNFLHNSWGPLEPYDDSMPQLLKEHGVYTHLISDHQHYWEDGGATYHHRYNTWEAVRGQEGDYWKGQVGKVQMPDHYGISLRQDVVNRQYIQTEEEQPQAKVFSLGFEFLEANREEDNWFLHLETFDPHEPFYSMQRYKELYPHDYQGKQFDWPPYGKVTEPREAVQHCRFEYAALLSMCDRYLGKLLDYMDSHHMWEDTMLIVNTDHGFLLSEHDCWAKTIHPFYNEIAHTPLFVWDPRVKVQGQRRTSLVQTIDLAPTLLDFFDTPIPPDMQGHPLKQVLVDDTPIREAGLFGLHGAQVNITDGRYVYMRAPCQDNTPLYDYTQMPTHMRTLYSVKEMRTMTLADPFSFTKGTKTMRIIADSGLTGGRTLQYAHTLYDLAVDPKQERPITDPEIEERLCMQMVQLMQQNDAPKEQYQRLDLMRYLTK